MENKKNYTITCRDTRTHKTVLYCTTPDQTTAKHLLYVIENMYWLPMPTATTEFEKLDRVDGLVD